jgi:hypothetical protein
MQNPGVFRVFVNQVDVGALPEQDYRAIVADAKRQVKGSRRVYLAQALNLIGCTWHLAKFFVLLMPLVSFFVVVFGVLAVPTEMAQALTLLRQMPAPELVAALRTLIWVFGILTSVAAGLTFAFTGYEFGYVNQFDSAINERISLRIRSILEVPAEGDVAVQVGKGFAL